MPSTVIVGGIARRVCERWQPPERGTFVAVRHRREWKVGRFSIGLGRSGGRVVARCSPGPVAPPHPRFQRACYRSARTGRMEDLSLVFGQSAPHAIRLADGQRVRPTLGQNRAPEAHLLCRQSAPPPRAAALALRVEEDLRADLSARPAQLPLPAERERTRKSGNLCHCVLREVSPCRLAVDATRADLPNKGHEGQELLKNLMALARHRCVTVGRAPGWCDVAPGGSPAHICSVGGEPA